MGEQVTYSISEAITNSNVDYHLYYYDKKVLEAFLSLKFLLL